MCLTVTTAAQEGVIRRGSELLGHFCACLDSSRLDNGDSEPEQQVQAGGGLPNEVKAECDALVDWMPSLGRLGLATFKSCSGVTCYEELVNEAKGCVSGFVVATVQRCCSCILHPRGAGAVHSLRRVLATQPV